MKKIEILIVIFIIIFSLCFGSELNAQIIHINSNFRWLRLCAKLIHEKKIENKKNEHRIISNMTKKTIIALNKGQIIIQMLNYLFRNIYLVKFWIIWLKLLRNTTTRNTKNWHSQTHKFTWIWKISLNCEKIHFINISFSFSAKSWKRTNSYDTF